MILKWKIFRLVNYIQLLFCFACTAFIYWEIFRYDLSFARAQEHLSVLVLTGCVFSFTCAFSIFNLSCLAVNYPANIYSYIRSKLLSVLLVLTSGSTLFYFLLFSYGYYDTFIKGNLNSLNQSVTILLIFALLFVTGVYSLVLSRVLKKEVTSTFRRLEEEKINALGNHSI